MKLTLAKDIEDLVIASPADLIEVDIGPGSYTEEEITAALASKRLTVDQAWFLHEQRISWRIDIREGWNG